MGTKSYQAFDVDLSAIEVSNCSWETMRLSEGSDDLWKTIKSILCPVNTRRSRLTLISLTKIWNGDQ